MHLLRRSLLIAAALVVLGAPAAGATCTALVGARAHMPDGVIDGVIVVMDGGKITAAGPGAAVPSGCATVDAAGKIVTAGLIHAASQLGLIEIGLEASSVDGKSDGSGPVRASFRVHEGYNPQGVAIPVSRTYGVTSAVIAPTGGTVSGQSAWVDLAGGTQAETVKQPSVAMHARFGHTEGSRATAVHTLRLLLTEAGTWSRKRGDWEKAKFRQFRFEATELEAMQPVLAREQPLVIAANRVSDIEAALRVAADFGVRVVVLGGQEAWRVADRLAAAKVPVILDPIINAPESFDGLSARADNAALLHRANVQIAIVASEFASHNLRKLAQVAGNAVRAGLDHRAAVHAITQAPADIFGMTDRGRLAAGAVANVVVWSGDPLELSSHPEHVFIAGQAIDLVSRQTRLRDRYRTLPGTPAAPVSLLP